MRRAQPVEAGRRSMVVAARSALGAAVVAAACGGGDDDSKGPVDVYASQYGNAVCAQWEGCCRENGLTFDRNHCGLFAAIYMQGDVDRHLAAGATFNPAAADACIAAAVEATQQCTRNEDFPTARKACALVWSGPKKVGDACKSDAECEGTDTAAGVCVGATSIQEGTCAKKTFGGSLGEPCGQATNATAPPEVVRDCGPDMQCALLVQTCTQLKKVGEGCDPFNRCEKGLFCDASSVCVAGLDAGAACDENAPEQCKSRVCINGNCGANPVGTLTPCTGAMK